MSRTIDARGLACPAPVIQTKDVLDRESPDTIQVIVDNEAARQNVSRFLESRNYTVSAQQVGTDFYVTGTQGGGSMDTPLPVPHHDDDARKKIMVMISSAHIGHGDDKLGSKLMASFLKTLEEMGDDLWLLVLLNSGVRLAVENSSMLVPLKALEESGVRILVCGTCLTHFNLLEKRQVGETTNMLDIVTAMQLADTVINI